MPEEGYIPAFISLRLRKRSSGIPFPPDVLSIMPGGGHQCGIKLSADCGHIWMLKYGLFLEMLQ